MTSRQFFFPFLSIFFHEINENGKIESIGVSAILILEQGIVPCRVKINRRTLHIKLDENNN